jgi:putative membrane protein
MALLGRGREAMFVCASSIMIASASAALLLPLSMAIFPLAYSFIEPHIWLALSVASLVLLASEGKAAKVALAFFVFGLSGALGFATLRIGIPDPLFPAFCGLFAASGILLSFPSSAKFPNQAEPDTRLDYLPAIAAGVVFGMLSDLLPGIAGPAQIAVFASAFTRIEEPKKFLALVSSVAASHAIFAFGTLVSIGKAREGSLAMINEVYPVGASSLPSLVGVVLLSAGISALVMLAALRHINAIRSLDMRALGLFVLIYLIVAVFTVSGGEGLLLFATSAALGMLPPLFGIRRTHLMGLIIVPSIYLAL